MKEYGEVVFGGGLYTLTQIAYADNNQRGETVYRASAVNADGDDCVVTWAITADYDASMRMHELCADYDAANADGDTYRMDYYGGQIAALEADCAEKGIIWDIDVEDESNACDWDCPIAVRVYGGEK